MYSRPVPKQTRFQIENAISSTQTLNKSSEIYDKDHLTNFFESLIKQLSDGKNKEFFNSVLNELKFSMPIQELDSETSELLLQPILVNYFQSPIIVHKSTLPEVVDLNKIIFSTMDRSNSFTTTGKLQRNQYYVFPGNDENGLLTYSEAYQKLGSNEIIPIRVFFG